MDKNNDLKNKKIHINGMTCVSCETLITDEVKAHAQEFLNLGWSRREVALELGIK